MRIAAWCALAMSTSAVAADDQAINLVCRGKVGRTEAARGAPLPFERGDRRVDYEEVAYLRVRPDNSGEAQVPKKMQPAYKEARDSWFPLVDVVRNPNEVTGKLRFHAMYKPKFKIDRLTGLLTIYGQLGDFAANCEKFDPANFERKF